MCARNLRAAARQWSFVMVLGTIFVAAYGLCLVADSRENAADDMAGRGSVTSESEHGDHRYQGIPLHPFCGVEFSESYTVAIATTMPLEGCSPMTQVGQLYVDKAAGAARVDHVFRGQRTSFLVDNRHLRGFFFFDTPSGDDAERSRSGSDGNNEGPSQRCHVFYLPRKVMPFCVPRRYTASSRESVVRGVPVTRFSGMERYDHTPLVEQSFYVLNATDAVGATPIAIPWRLELRARSDLEPSTISGAPYKPPNWRLFGHPMFDELVLSPAQESRLQTWVPAYNLLTVDFYNYYPSTLKPDVFAVPPQCTAVLHKGTSTGGGAPEEASASKRNETASSTVTEPLLELATIQLFLIQWHALQNTSAGWHVAKKGDAQ
ncbi:hypothetical protein GH5_00921 [Leishmania sp. Ghana 2012 LV757]|uniref:hypothetical protein n=1 Tax=Leishmania sp. Ghana 2012 LV757 TaxID=2803181 RepID=UPI001B6D1507|nr:hypothetical protein GH5_00921 [Leishmania sp. Ghana 2012 LV757]